MKHASRYFVVPRPTGVHFQFLTFGWKMQRFTLSGEEILRRSAACKNRPATRGTFLHTRVNITRMCHNYSEYQRVSIPLGGKREETGGLLIWIMHDTKCLLAKHTVFQKLCWFWRMSGDISCASSGVFFCIKHHSHPRLATWLSCFRGYG